MNLEIIPPEITYVIRRTDTYDPFFFLYDCIDMYDLNIDTVLWTPNRHKAREFYTEETVETYLFDNLKNRPCEIIMVN
jgi:hypothetical protein